MPPAYTSQQKAAIGSFVSFTNIDRGSAARHLKQYNWNVESAVNGYYNGGAAAAPQNSAVKAGLSKVFDSLRDEPKTSPDGIGTTGTLSYFEKIGVDPSDIGVFVISELLQCPSMGEITRDGFVDGWAATGDDDLAKQTSRMPAILDNLSSDRAHFNRVYKYTFPLVKSPEKKALELEEAIEYWRILFASAQSPVQWTSSSAPWLDWWIDFLQSKWKKSVNKDMWEQTLKFADETLQDGSLGFWTEDSAWPGVIDEFVEYANEKLGNDKKAVDEDEDMEY